MSITNSSTPNNQDVPPPEPLISKNLFTQLTRQYPNGFIIPAGYSAEYRKVTEEDLGVKKTLDSQNNLVTVDSSVFGFYLIILEELENKYFLDVNNENIFFGTPTGKKKLMCNLRKVEFPGGPEAICAALNATVPENKLDILKFAAWPQPLKSEENAT